MNRSEEFTFRVARRVSLTLWSYATPLNSSTGKELCDVLIVFGSNIAILSVKEIELQSDSPVHVERWWRRAVESSVKQIYGAERSLRSATHIIRSDGSKGLSLPTLPERRIHRIAVALGSKGKAPIATRDYGKGDVHVFDETSLEIILSELDTPADLFSYLTDKLTFLNTASHVLLEGGEEDLLAVYLANQRTFPKATGVVAIGPGIWGDFSAHPEYIAKKKADRASQIWDGLIETIARDALSGTLEFGSSLTDTEMALRRMAAEDRYSRRILGISFDEFLKKSASSIRSRLCLSPSGTTYVFLATPHGTNRQDRAAELLARCFVARGKVPQNPIVIGIATEQYTPGKGFSIDLLFFSKPDWTLEDQQIFDAMQSNTSYFKGSLQKSSDEPEYPI